MTDDPFRTGDAVLLASLVDLVVTIRRHLDGTRPGGAGRTDRRSGVVPAGDEPFVCDGGDARVTSRRTEEGVLVVVDLRGVERNDRETEVDLAEDSLVLTVDERLVWRVPIEPGGTSITAVSVNNDVLEVRVGADE